MLKIFLRNFYNSRFSGWIIAAVYMALAGAMLYVIDYHPRVSLETLLMNGTPWSLRINFLLILIGVGAWIDHMVRLAVAGQESL